MRADPRFRTTAPEPRPRMAEAVGYMLPVLGNRDDTCARYTSCLTAHVARHQRGAEVSASCPVACSYREPLVERATAYMRQTGDGVP